MGTTVSTNPTTLRGGVYRNTGRFDEKVAKLLKPTGRVVRVPDLETWRPRQIGYPITIMPTNFGAVYTRV